MFLNCGQATPSKDAVRLVIWDGAIEYVFTLTIPDVSALLQERAESIPVGRQFGLLENKAYGRARLTNPCADGQRKGVAFWFPCFPGRLFSVSRVGLAGVARSVTRGAGDHWLDAVVSEMIPDPGPVRASARDCFGCQDLEIRQYRDRKIRVCGVSGTTFRQTATCPKMTTTRPEMAPISGGDYQ